jgi:hypothetical protein
MSLQCGGLVFYKIRYLHGGDTASTWVVKHREHTGAHEDLVKNVQTVIGNDYQLAA